MNKLDFFPVNGRVIVKPTKEEFTTGGIALPITSEEKPEVGTVIAIDTTEPHPLNDIIKEGTKILFNRFAATRPDKEALGDEYLLIIKDSISLVFHAPAEPGEPAEPTVITKDH